MASLKTELILLAALYMAAQLIAQSEAGRKEDSYNLINHIMDPVFYQSNVIPVSSESTNVSMTMQLQLLSIVQSSLSTRYLYRRSQLALYHTIPQVSEKEQTLVTNTRLYMTWEDYYLSWSPSKFGNITSMLLEQDTLWLPDVSIANTVEPSVMIGSVLSNS
ncbi:neuronal acetylcholine receptor subunit beta-2 [Elysia marginata]|uniref:Neuronal acetylcholine receptor subunit beta-2 n=1 Tax=Elysia marginata TaxID=1093978 RepID=A0AAV4JJL2_9GAST|nr:neuronal acetylcholine receptor subunit beta-2 [Elysia marginata]